MELRAACWWITATAAFHNLGEPEAYAQTRDELGECAPREFMARYLELAKEDLLVG